eukprot:COSAG01_NODE_53299_length_340_cov_0.842324_1_plen_25_part_01
MNELKAPVDLMLWLSRSRDPGRLPW